VGGGGGVDGLLGEVVESTGCEDAVAWGGVGGREGLVVVQVSFDFLSASVGVVVGRDVGG
jgi:acetyl-CoA carboxylase beta subunit